ncbi:MAG TPA: alpha/beta hydrolase [Pirellulales bacterium]|nr:alpha/beta hydrolase [Pirellulales bacterium]
MTPTNALRTLAWLAPLVAVIATGCTPLRTLYPNALWDDRLERGYTLVFPGIEGADPLNGNIARGIDWAGVPTAIEVVDWTTGIPPLLLAHLRWDWRNERQAARITQKIAAYQAEHPGKPVNLVGHSGGGAMCLLVLEQMPEGTQIDSVVLLAAAISPRYEIEPALAKTRRGIWNFYSPLDATLLLAGTTIAGTVDGRHTPAAGAIGFRDDDRRLVVLPKLQQIAYTPEMALRGHFGNHFGCCDPRFVQKYVGPVLSDQKASESIAGTADVPR